MSRKCDVVVVGGGISGQSWLLRVLLLAPALGEVPARRGVQGGHGRGLCLGALRFSMHQRGSSVSRVLHRTLPQGAYLVRP